MERTHEHESKAKRPRKTSSPRKKKVVADQPSGCGYKLTWSVLASTKGMTQVWIPTKTYEKIAAPFLKGAKGKYEKQLLRARMAPLGVDTSCGGTCSGGWCEEHLIHDYGSSKVYVCECGYYV